MRHVQHLGIGILKKTRNWMKTILPKEDWLLQKEMVKQVAQQWELIDRG